jgi:hypothetical protein
MEPERESRVIEERATQNWVGADGFMRSKIRAGTDFTVEDSQAALRATKTLVTELPTPVLVDCRGVRTATRDSRLFWETPEAKRTLSAMAMLVGSPVSRMIVSFFVRLVRPDFQLRSFTSEEDAVRWLREVSR